MLLLHLLQPESNLSVQKVWEDPFQNVKATRRMVPRIPQTCTKSRKRNVKKEYTLDQLAQTRSWYPGESECNHPLPIQWVTHDHDFRDKPVVQRPQPRQPLSKMGCTRHSLNGGQFPLWNWSTQVPYLETIFPEYVFEFLWGILLILERGVCSHMRPAKDWEKKRILCSPFSYP